MPRIRLLAVLHQITLLRRLYQASKHTRLLGSRSHLLQMEGAHSFRPNQGHICSRSMSIPMTNTCPDQALFHLQSHPRITGSVG